MTFLRTFLLFLLLPVIAAAQEDDRGFLTRFLEDNLSGAGRSVVITGFAGALSSRASIEQLTIADDQGIWLTLNKVVLDWNRAAVLRGRIDVTALTAEEIILARPPVMEAASPSPEASGFALPTLPVSVDVRQVAAERIVLGEAVLGTALTASLTASAQLAGGEGQGQLALIRTDDGPAGQVTLTASYANDTRRLLLDLAANEAAGGIAATLIGLPGAPETALTVQGDGPLDDFAAELSLTTDGVERLGGRVTLSSEGSGADQIRRFTADLGGDPAPLFLPEYAAFFGNDVALQVAGLRRASGVAELTSLSVQTDALTLDGSLRLAADGLPEVIALTGRIAQADGSRVLLPTAGEDRVYVQSVDLTLAFDAAQDEGWTGRAVVAGLDTPTLDAGRTLISGSGRIARTALGRTLGATLRFAAADLVPADAALAEALGTGVVGEVKLSWLDGQPLNLSQITLAGSDYTLSARGKISGLESGLAITGKASADVADLERFSALAGRPLGGQATLTADLAGSPLGGDFDVTAAITGTALQIGQTEVDNLLRGTSHITLSAVRDVSGTTLRQLDVAAGTLEIKARGTLQSAGSTLSADLRFDDLAVLGGPYRGSLNAAATFTGTPAAGAMTLTGQGNGLAIGQEQADRLLAGTTALDLALRLADGVVTLDHAEVTNPTLTGAATGTVSAAGSNVVADLRLADLGRLGAGYGGGLTGRAAFAGTPAQGQFTLTAAARGLALGQSQADVLLRGNSTLDLALRTENGAIIVDRAKLANPQVSVDATGSVAGNQRRVDLTARLVNLGLLLPEFPGPLTVAGEIVDSGAGYQLNLTGKGPGQIDLRAAGRVATNFGSADLTLTGSAQAALANAFVQPASVQGPLRFDLRLNGPLALRSLSGRVALTGGRVAAPTLGIGLDNLNVTANLAGGQARLEAVTGVRAGGSVTLRGTVGMTAPFAGDLTATLNGVVLRDPQLYQTRANGQVSITGPLTGGALIAGAITLPDTEIRISSVGLGGGGGLEGLRHVNEPAAVRETRARAGLLQAEDAGGRSGSSRPYALDLVIRAPNRVFLRGRGLDAELGGILRLNGTTAAIVPSGAFTLIRGRLDILGQRLVVSEAQVRLEGNFDPVLRLVATNQNNGITSNVVVEGTVDAPEVSFTSSPELPEEEVLAHLLFGRDLTQLSAFQAAQLAGAVATLAGRGGEGIVAKLRKGFGLDDFDVESQEGTGPTVRAGKYLAKNVYSELIVGPSGTTDITLNFDVRPGLTLRGTAGSAGDTGFGIFMEKDY